MVRAALHGTAARIPFPLVLPRQLTVFLYPRRRERDLPKRTAMWESECETPISHDDCATQLRKRRQHTDTRTCFPVTPLPEQLRC